MGSTLVGIAHNQTEGLVYRLLNPLGFVAFKMVRRQDFCAPSALGRNPLRLKIQNFLQNIYLERFFQ